MCFTSAEDALQKVALLIPAHYNHKMKDTVGEISAQIKLVLESFVTQQCLDLEANPVSVNVQRVSGLTRR